MKIVLTPTHISLAVFTLMTVLPAVLTYVWNSLAEKRAGAGGFGKYGHPVLMGWLTSLAGLSFLIAKLFKIFWNYGG